MYAGMLSRVKPAWCYLWRGEMPGSVVRRVVRGIHPPRKGDLGTREARDYLRDKGIVCSQRDLAVWAKRGRLSAAKWQNRWWFDRAALDRFHKEYRKR